MLFIFSLKQSWKWNAGYSWKTIILSKEVLVSFCVQLGGRVIQLQINMDPQMVGEENGLPRFQFSGSMLVWRG